MPRSSSPRSRSTAPIIRGFKPATFAGWAKQVPDDFVFTLKASRYCTNRKVLAEAGESIARFAGQGIVELGDKLGPILWQFMATKRFDPDDFARIPPAAARRAGRRHSPPRDPRPPRQLRRSRLRRHVPQGRRRDRLCRLGRIPRDRRRHRRLRLRPPRIGEEEVATGYTAPALDRWAGAARTWAAGGKPDGLPYVEDDGRHRGRRATRSSSSSTVQRSGHRRGRWL